MELPEFLAITNSFVIQLTTETEKWHQQYCGMVDHYNRVTFERDKLRQENINLKVDIRLLRDRLK